VRPLATRAAAIVALASLSVTTGCSDEVVCSDDTTPYVSARVEQVGAARAGSTYVEAYCSNDPLPGMFDVSVSDRELPDPVEAPDQLGLLTSLTETLVIWQPGTNCLLEVATEFGIATALETVPGPFEVAAPGTIAVSETLTVSWTASEDADYYVVEAWHAGSASVIDVAVEGTATSFTPSELPGSGLLSGRVRAVAGPFPSAGTSGNVTGEGWGYFTVSYRDAGGDFEVVLVDRDRD
jgi:hypothetical protein